MAPKKSFLSKSDAYDWKFGRVGGVTRVRIETGEDIRHLPELDKKLWTVLSCPVNGLELDAATLTMLDADKDGKIKVDEVVAAASWMTSVVKDADGLTKGSAVFPLDGFNTDNADAAALLESSKEVLRALGKAGENEISVAEVEDSTRILAATSFNGDGIITTKSAGDDADLAAVIADIIAAFGSVTDRSGEEGVNQEKIDAFFKACEDFRMWQIAGQADKKNIFPYGDDTAAALAALEAVKDKVDDWFLRCKLAAFALEKGSTGLDVSQEKIAALGEGNLVSSMADIAEYPLCKVSAEGILSLDEKDINPAWRDRIAAFRSFVCKGGSLSEAEWKSIQASFDAYRAWLGAKAGAEVESLGLQRASSLLGDGTREKLAALMAEDLKYEPQFSALDMLDKFLHLYRDFFTLLKNYVTFSDFYDRDRLAVFQAGRLYIDQRSCDLCIKVTDMGNQEKMAFLSGCYLLFCSCTSKVRSDGFTIMASMTVGSGGNIQVGKNGIFYDRDGFPWDATVTKIIENPISISEAFWSPYRKLAAFIDDKINKAAADKDSKTMGEMTSKVGEGMDKPAEVKEKAQPFDIAKFAGIFAAIGMAVGFLASALVSAFTGFAKLPWWGMLLTPVVIMLLISGPSMFLAWRKLIKRNLSPILNANGWAMNANVKINIRFGETLSSQAKYPKVALQDPFEAKKMSAWKKWCLGILIALVAACAVLYFTGTYKRFLPQEEASVEASAPEAPAEAAPEAASEAAAEPSAE